MQYHKICQFHFITINNYLSPVCLFVSLSVDSQCHSRGPGSRPTDNKECQQCLVVTGPSSLRSVRQRSSQQRWGQQAVSGHPCQATSLVTRHATAGCFKLSLIGISNSKSWFLLEYFSIISFSDCVTFPSGYVATICFVFQQIKLSSLRNC